MVHQRIKKSSWTPPIQAKGSQLAPRPFPVQAQQKSHRPPTQEEIENEAFERHKFEAFGLQLKKKHGTIRPVERERLGVLQAKIDNFRARLRERATAGPSLSEVLARNVRATQTTEPEAPARPNAIQAKGDTTGDRLEPSVEQQPNKTGLPDALKAGVEGLSGYSLDDVRVRFNSPKPAQIEALAYTQGTDIHVAPGQEEHLPHEAWHVVQQKQGRAKPTVQTKGGLSINADAGLEREADIMGARSQHQPLVMADDLYALNAVTNFERVIQGCWNKKFQDYLFDKKSNSSKIEHWEGNKNFSLYLANRSLEKEESEKEKSDKEKSEKEKSDKEKSPKAAYIINAILPYTNLHEMPNVVGEMVRGIDESDYSRIAVILGVNAPKNKASDLDNALQKQAKQEIENFPFPVAIVKSTFVPNKSKGFPYGTMRNEVLHSRETKEMTKYFSSVMDLHPYISFQDFDMGSRSVGDENGMHIFYAVDKILRDGFFNKVGLDEDLYEPKSKKAKYSEEPERQEIEDFVSPMRPLMIAGGYRTGTPEKLKEMVEQKLKEKPINNFDMQELEQKLEEFANVTKQDMKYRDQYARIHPMLPYAPEPNLFIDATAAYKGSPLSETKLEFSEFRDEYTELAKNLARYAAEELEYFYSEEYAKAKKNEVVPPTTPLKDFIPDRLDDSSLENNPEVTEKYLRDTTKDVVSKLLIDAQNNRHPVRGQSFFVDFENMAIETDLSRLAYDFLKGKLTQGYKGLKLIQNRIFKDRENDKKGIKLAATRDKFNEEIKQKGLAGLAQEESQITESEQAKKYDKKLVGGVGKELSPVFSIPFSEKGPFTGLYFGLKPYEGEKESVERSPKQALLHQISTVQELEKILNQENF
ncbi:MAG: DUF4157 domain-containing protein [Oscillatoria sp. SIO1A7]|nr:DUF4157 domain-containing protein [Oscillatoria sp. SIO1A7]